jgi:hypothetical protein
MIFFVITILSQVYYVWEKVKSLHCWVVKWHMDTVMILKSYRWENYEHMYNNYRMHLYFYPSGLPNFISFLELHNYYTESKICHSQLGWMQIKPHRYEHTNKNGPPLHTLAKKRTASRLFKNTNIQTSFKTINTIRHHLKPKNINIDIFNKSRIYQLKCNDSQLKYIEQTIRSFWTCFKQHIQAVRPKKPNSKFAQHTLDTQYTYDMVEETMYMLHIVNKGPVLNTWELFHIQNLITHKLQMNDTYTNIHNSIFDLIIKTYPT